MTNHSSPEKHTLLERLHAFVEIDLNEAPSVKVEFWSFANGWSVVIDGKVTEGAHFFKTFARAKALCFRLGLLTPTFEGDTL